MYTWQIKDRQWAEFLKFHIPSIEERVWEKHFYRQVYKSVYHSEGNTVEYGQTHDPGPVTQ